MHDSTAVADVQAQLPRWFKSTVVAVWCGVSLNTLHRWCSTPKGPPHQRTPGGQLRFREDLIGPWLLEHGFALPAELQ